MGELINASDQFLARGKVAINRLIPANVIVMDNVVYHAGELEADFDEGGYDDDREYLIEEAVQAAFDHFDILSMAEYSPVLSDEKKSLAQRMDDCFSMLSDEEKVIATSRFNEAIGKNPEGEA